MSNFLSQFAPSSFSNQDGVALLAGKGDYPKILARKLKEANIPSILIAFEDETADELWNLFETDKRFKIKIGQLGKLLKILGKANFPYAVMAGQITPKKLFKGLRPDWKAFCLLRSLKQKNAETIFSAIGNELKKVGVTLLDGRFLMDEHLATNGQMGRIRFKIKAHFLDHGISIAKETARLDIGQGIVFHKGTILAVEAFEGTDKMLQRIGQFESKQACFVKTVKPNQDYRFDVPVFGMRTIKNLIDNKIKHVALESGSTIILNKPEVIAAADSHKIAIYGY